MEYLFYAGRYSLGTKRTPEVSFSELINLNFVVGVCVRALVCELLVNSTSQKPKSRQVPELTLVHKIDSKVFVKSPQRHT